MKLGIKLGPDTSWKQDIESTHPAMVEIWYNVAIAAQYDDMFAYLSRENIDIGLHYWGALPNGLLTNIAYPDPAIYKPSLALIRATIDTAAKNHCRYVNIHNDMRVLMNIDANFTHVSVASDLADLTECTNTFLENAAILKQYAETQGIVLTIETVPLQEKTDWNADRNTAQIFDSNVLPMDIFPELIRRGLRIANDFCHTASNMISDDRGTVWQYLYNTTKTLAPATRLIHLGFIVPPYNGTDNHDTLANPVIDTPAAIPNKNQMIELFKLFPNRPDMWILVEPKGDHVKNYFLARGILEKAGLPAGEAGVLTQ